MNSTNYLVQPNPDNKIMYISCMHSTSLIMIKADQQSQLCMNVGRSLSNFFCRRACTVRPSIATLLIATCCCALLYEIYNKAKKNQLSNISQTYLFNLKLSCVRNIDILAYS